MAREAEINEYRTCLYCRVEIAEGRPNHTNFCNDEHQKLFRAGMTKERYDNNIEANKLIPIRGAKPAQKIQRERRRSDNIYHRLCKLSEYDQCNVKFSTEIEHKMFCEESHQVKYNSIKKQERKVARRSS